MGTRYLLIYWRRSETGYVRDENRDGMSCVEPHFGELCIVSDGMGADVQTMVDELVDLALEKGGEDSIYRPNDRIPLFAAARTPIADSPDRFSYSSGMASVCKEKRVGR